MARQYKRMEHLAGVVKESSRRNQPNNSGKLRFNTQADKEIGEPEESEGTTFGCGIYPATKKAAKKK